MKKLYLFDFDGTLTRRDTFLDFILFNKGIVFFLSLFMKFGVKMARYKLGFYSAEKLKIDLFSAAFLGEDQKSLEILGENYLKARHSKLFFQTILDKYLYAVKEGHDVYVISASLDVWLKAFVKEFGGHLICTELAYDKGVFNGQLATPNCNKEEKANRIKAEINLNDYSDILAYGNSSGDKAMFGLSTQHYKV